MMKTALRTLFTLLVLFAFLAPNFPGTARASSPQGDTPLRSVAGEGVGAQTVQFSPDGKLLAVGYANGVVKLWGTHTWNGLATLNGHTDSVRALAFSPEGNLLVSGGPDKTLRFWEPAPEWGSTRTLQVNMPVNALAFAPDGKKLAMASDAALIVWEPTTHRILQRFSVRANRSGFPVQSVAFSPDGKLLVGGTPHSVAVWDTADWSQIQDLKTPSPVVSLGFSPDGKRLSGSDAFGRTWVWNRGSWELQRMVPGGGARFAPGSRTLALVGNDSLTLCDAQSGHATARIFSGKVNQIAFAPDGASLAASREDGEIQLWSLASPAKTYSPFRRAGSDDLADIGRPSDGRPDSLTFTTAAGVPTRVVRVNLADPRVRVTVQTANGFPHGAERFETLIARAQPTIAMNGTYFDVASGEPIGSIVVGGQLVYEGFMGTAMALTADKRGLIRRVKRGRTEDWSQYETVLCCGPALVLGGKVDVREREEGFGDPHIMGSTARVGVGLTADRHLLLVQTLAPITFARWGQVMRALGCVDAMNLDAGSSRALYYRGRTLVSASRPLTNLLLVYVDSGSGSAGLPSRSGGGRTARSRKRSNVPIGEPPAKEVP